MYDVYRTYVGAGVPSIRCRTINDHKRDLLMEAQHSPDFHPDTMRNGVVQPLLLTRGGENHSYNVICMPDDELFAGDMIDAFGEKWLVMEARADATTHKTGRMTQCNHLFRFQNFDSTIIERWGIIDQSGYSSTVTGTNQMQKSEEQCAIYLPYDEDTAKIYVDKRLASHVAYEASGQKILATLKITSHTPNSNSYNRGDHLLTLKAIRDVYSESTDNMELEICDYIAPGSETPPVPPEKLKCEIQGKVELMLGRTRTYTPVFYLSDGVTVDDKVVPVWDTQDVDGVSYSFVDNTLRVKAGTADALIGATVPITLRDADGLYEPVTLVLEVSNIA